MTDRYAVIGNPIAHSKSPFIHSMFAQQTGQALEYVKILGDPDDFAGDVRLFVAAGGRGLNVTVPFKEAAWRLLEDVSERAAQARAVNTLVVRDGGLLYGDNTDGVGLLRDLADNHGFVFAGRRVVLLGAGGAARGVIRPLLETGLAALIVANRTRAKAEALAAAHAAHGPVVARGLDELAACGCDLIINATAAELSDTPLSLPPGVLAPGGWVYDLFYGATPTAFCRWGEAQGAARVLDGLGMLVEQAAESFWLWRGVRPRTAPVIAALAAARHTHD